jgi:hypothetical protein
MMQLAIPLSAISLLAIACTCKLVPTSGGVSCCDEYGPGSVARNTVDLVAVLRDEGASRTEALSAALAICDPDEQSVSVGNPEFELLSVEEQSHCTSCVTAIVELVYSD